MEIGVTMVTTTNWSWFLFLKIYKCCLFNGIMCTPIIISVVMDNINIDTPYALIPRASDKTTPQPPSCPPFVWRGRWVRRGGCSKETFVCYKFLIIILIKLYRFLVEELLFYMASICEMGDFLAACQHYLLAINIGFMANNALCLRLLEWCIIVLGREHWQLSPLGYFKFAR